MNKRPFKLYERPTTNLAVKYGRRTSRAAEKLKYFLIVSRNKEKDLKGVLNFKRRNDLMEKIVQNEEYQSPHNKNFPSDIPITLVSDDPDENFSLFRGFFNKRGELGCGAVYGSDTAERRFYDKKDIENGIVSKDDELPYEVDCSSKCTYWKNGGCDLTGTLYFKLDESVGASNELGSMMINGTFAQRSISSSLKMLHKETNGILKNLPLLLSIHFEQRQPVGQSRYFSIPFITIKPRFGPSRFRKYIVQEVERRKEEYRIFYMDEPTTLEDIKEFGALSDMISRESIMNDLQTIDDESENIDEGIEETFDVDDEIKEIMKDMPENLMKLAIDKFTDDKTGDIDIEALKSYVEEQSRQQDKVFDL